MSADTTASQGALRTRRVPGAPEGSPGSIVLDRGEPTKAPTKAELLWAMTRRLEAQRGASCKVTISRNAKHEYQYAVEVAGEDAQACADEAQRIEQALAVVYPPPPVVKPEHK